jgi:hypothetical protein
MHTIQNLISAIDIAFQRASAVSIGNVYRSLSLASGGAMKQTRIWICILIGIHPM